MTATLTPGDTVRVLRSGGHLTVGDIATIDDTASGGAWVTVPHHDKPVWVYTDDVEPVVDDGLHRITERTDGPDLDDLVRLIRYLREHNVLYRFEADPSGSTLRWHPVEPGSWPHVYEGTRYSRPDGVVFVGPDGTVYDADRNPL